MALTPKWPMKLRKLNKTTVQCQHLIPKIYKSIYIFVCFWVKKFFNFYLVLFLQLILLFYCLFFFFIVCSRSAPKLTCINSKGSTFCPFSGLYLLSWHKWSRIKQFNIRMFSPLFTTATTDTMSDLFYVCNGAKPSRLRVLSHLPKREICDITKEPISFSALCVESSWRGRILNVRTSFKKLRMNPQVKSY